MKLNYIHRMMARTCFMLLWVHAAGEIVSTPEYVYSFSCLQFSNRVDRKLPRLFERGMASRRYYCHGCFLYSDHSITAPRSHTSLRALLLHPLPWRWVGLGFLCACDLFLTDRTQYIPGGRIFPHQWRSVSAH